MPNPTPKGLLPLKGCPNPWCKHNEPSYYNTQQADDGSIRAELLTCVRCPKCGLEGPKCVRVGDAESAWNTRPTPDLEPVRMALAKAEYDRDRLLVALVKATEQGVQRFGMENRPTLFHSFISAWERSFPLLVEFGMATEEESEVEILVDDEAVDALDRKTWETDPATFAHLSTLAGEGKGGL